LHTLLFIIFLDLYRYLYHNVTQSCVFGGFHYFPVGGIRPDDQILLLAGGNAAVVFQFYDS